MRSKRLFAAFVLVAMVAIVTLLFGTERTPRVAGKSIRFWLDEMDAGGARSNAAVAVFVKQGRAGALALTHELRYVPAARTNLIHLKARLPWAIASRLPRATQINYLRRYAAIYALEQLGPEAKEGIPALIATVTTGDTAELMMPGSGGGMLIGQSWSHHLRAAAMDALAKIDPDNPAVLLTAANLVAEGETALGPARPAMAVAYQSGLRALETARHPDPAAIKNVLQIIRAGQRETYFRTLGAFVAIQAPNRGSSAARHVLFGETNTIVALQNGNANEREAAAFELGDADREGSSGIGNPELKISTAAVAALLHALMDQEQIVRLNAAETLVNFGQSGHDIEITAALSGLLPATNSLVRLRAVDNLLRLGTKAPSALEKVRETEHDPVGFVRVWAKEAERQISNRVDQ